MKNLPLSMSEKIDRAKDGRSQVSIINKMNQHKSISITDVQFSRKKKGIESFTPEELKVLNLVIGTDF